MKPVLPTSLALFLLVFVPAFTMPVPSCLATPANVAGKPQEDEDKKDSTKPPFEGMTKAQAKHYYGEPDSVGHRGGEELWTYVLNRGEAIGKSFIPFHNTKLRYRLLTFRGDRVVSFRWDAPGKE